MENLKELSPKEKKPTAWFLFCMVLSLLLIIGSCGCIGPVFIHLLYITKLQSYPAPLGPIVDTLQAVSASSPNDIWAVGNYSTKDGPRTLLEHWDGSNWEIFPHPTDEPMSGSDANETLAGIAALAPNNIWVVGNTGIKHWDGQQWKHWLANKFLPTDLPGFTVLPTDLTRTSFYGISALSADDIWAVGYGFRLDDSYHYVIRPLVAHWDGKQWKLSTLKNTGTPVGILRSITVINAHNAWAVGYTAQNLTIPIDSTPDPTIFPNGNVPPDPALFHLPSYLSDTPHVPTSPLIEHWDGHRWTAEEDLNLPDARLLSVSASSTGDIWTVGYSITSPSNQQGHLRLQTISAHSNGQGWQTLTGPSLAPDVSLLDAVVTFSPRDAWAAGYSGATFDDRANRQLLEYWDGVNWNVVRYTSADTSALPLAGLVAFSPNDIWAVGDSPLDVSGYSGQNNTQTLTEIVHWNGQSWNTVPHPNPMQRSRPYLTG